MRRRLLSEKIRMKAFRVICLAVALCGFGVTLHAELANAIWAIVHDSVITKQEVENNTAPVRDELIRRYGNQPEVYNQKLGEALNDAVERLVERQLILHEFAT